MKKLTKKQIEVLHNTLLQYESTIFAGIGNACTAVQTALKQGGCDNAKALSELAAVVESTQALLDMQNTMGAL